MAEGLRPLEFSVFRVLMLNPLQQCSQAGWGGQVMRVPKPEVQLNLESILPSALPATKSSVNCCSDVEQFCNQHLMGFTSMWLQSVANTIEMATKVQSKNYLPGYHSMQDIKVDAPSSWSSYYKDKKFSDHLYNTYVSRLTNGHLEDDKEMIKQMMLEHEAIFRKQVQNSIIINVHVRIPPDVGKGSVAVQFWLPPSSGAVSGKKLNTIEHEMLISDVAGSPVSSQPIAADSQKLEGFPENRRGQCELSLDMLSGARRGFLRRAQWETSYQMISFSVKEEDSYDINLAASGTVFLDKNSTTTRFQKLCKTGLYFLSFGY